MVLERGTEIKVNSKQPYTAFVNQSKETFINTEAIQLHGMGEATSTAVKAAEMLVSLGYATMERFETTTLNEKDRSGISRRRFKVIIELSKSPNFDQVYEEFKKSRETSK